MSEPYTEADLQLAAEAEGKRRNGAASDGRGWYRTEADREECFAIAAAALDALAGAGRLPAEHLTVMRAAVRDVWRLALQWQGDDDTEQQASDIFTALSPLVAWEAERLPVAEQLPGGGRD